MFVNSSFAQQTTPTNTKPITRHVLNFTIDKFSKAAYGSIPNNKAGSIIKKIKNDSKNENIKSIEYGLEIEKISFAFFNELFNIEKKLTGNDEIIIFFSSHGVEAISDLETFTNEKSALLYIITDEEKDNWIPLVEVVKILSNESFKRAKKLIIVDTCRFYDTTNNQIIGKNMKDFAKKNSKFNENDVDFKKYMEGDITADLNLILMFACSSGMKAYFNIDKQFAFFSESLNLAFSFDKQGNFSDNKASYSIKEIFKKTKSLTIYQNKAYNFQRQEPVMIKFEKPVEEQKSIENIWFFGMPPLRDEINLAKEIFDSNNSESDSSEIFNKQNLVDLIDIYEIQNLMKSIENDINEIDRYHKGNATYNGNIANRVVQIFGQKNVTGKYNLKNIDEVLPQLVDFISKNSKSINNNSLNIQSFQKLANMIVDSYNVIYTEFERYYKNREDLIKKIDELIGQSEKIINFNNELQKLRDASGIY